MSSNFDALNEAPYLSITGMQEDPLEKELDDYNSLQGLRNITSRLHKNNPVAAGFLLTYLNAFMGGSIDYEVVGSEVLSKSLTKILVDQFGGLDINRLYDINKIFEYLIVGSFKSGDILVHMPLDKERGDITTMVELVEANRIVTPWNLARDPLIKNGVKYSAGGRIEGYYVRPVESFYMGSHLNERDYSFIPLRTSMFGGYRQNCYMFKSPLHDEPGSARCFPALIPCSKYLRYMMQYVKAVIIGARVGACFAGFIHTKNPAAAKGELEKNNALEQVGTLNPGGVYYLRQGEEITFGSPSRPADNSDQAIKRLHILSASSVRLPYELAALHLENTSFSSWKGGINEIRANRNRYLNSFNKIAYFISNNYAQEALVKGMIRGDITKLKYSFKFPRFDPLDSEKRARSDKLNIETEISNRRRACEEANVDYEQNEIELLKTAKDTLKRQVELVVEKERLETEFNVKLPETIEAEQKESESSNTGEPSTDEQKEVRKQDGNW